MFKVGQKVRFIDTDEHNAMPSWYPPAGWAGVIIKANYNGMTLVDWGSDSEVKYNYTRNSHAWWCAECMLGAVDAEN